MRNRVLSMGLVLGVFASIVLAQNDTVPNPRFPIRTLQDGQLFGILVEEGSINTPIVWIYQNSLPAIFVPGEFAGAMAPITVEGLRPDGASTAPINVILGGTVTPVAFTPTDLDTWYVLDDYALGLATMIGIRLVFSDPAPVDMVFEFSVKRP